MKGDRGYWDRPRRNLSRRRFLTATSLAGLGAASLPLVGCGGDDDDAGSASGSNGGSSSSAPPTNAAAPTANVAQVKRGGTIKGSTGVTFSDVWDPHRSLTSAGLLWNMIGNLALRPNRDASKIEGELVEKTEVPGDGTEILLTIRKGVKWHDKAPVNGREMTAADVAFNLSRISGKLNPAEATQFPRRSTLPNFESATPVDASVVRVKLTAPHSGFLRGLSDFRNSFLPPELIEQGVNLGDATKLVGTGPWTITSFDNTQKIVLAPVKSSWEPDVPYIAGLEFISFGDRLSTQTAFAQGQIDLFEAPTKTERETLKKLAGDKVREEKWTHHGWSSLRMNTKKEVFADPRARKAMFLALNYKAAADAVHGDGYWTATGPLSIFPEAFTPADISKMPGFNPATKEKDIADAKALMAQVFPNGDFSFKLLQASSAQPSELAVRFLDQMKAVWPKANIELELPADAAAFAKRLNAGDYDMNEYTLGGLPDSILELESQYSTTGSRNYQKWADAEFDALLLKASTQFDIAARTETLRQAQQRAIDDPTLVKYALPSYVTYYGNYVKGAEGYGSAGSYGTYDTRFAFKKMWLDKA